MRWKGAAQAHQAIACLCLWILGLNSCLEAKADETEIGATQRHGWFYSMFEAHGSSVSVQSFHCVLINLFAI